MYDHTAVAVDALCVGCDYNLRTLPIDGVCPECGTPALKTFWPGRPGPLRLSPAWWVRRLRLGCTFLILGVLGTALVRFAAMSQPNKFFEHFLPFLPASTLVPIGILLITTREPVAMGFHPSHTIRFGTRVVILAWLAVLIPSGIFISSLMMDHPYRLYTSTVHGIMEQAGRTITPFVFTGRQIALMLVTLHLYFLARRSAARFPPNVIITLCSIVTILWAFCFMLPTMPHFCTILMIDDLRRVLDWTSTVFLPVFLPVFRLRKVFEGFGLNLADSMVMETWAMLVMWLVVLIQVRRTFNYELARSAERFE